MVSGQFNPQPDGKSFRLADTGLPSWPCSACQTVSWRKEKGHTVCGSCQDYGERLRMTAELERER